MFTLDNQDTTYQVGNSTIAEKLPQNWPIAIGQFYHCGLINAAMLELANQKTTCEVGNSIIAAKLPSCHWAILPRTI
jgi:hypothetical protein